ncbi:3-hydroxyacyl-CoA dehydrogenase [Microbacterium koreense]|uniref:3-hydroxyacyl-CoA dehydrogenase n=1 Tax=Microbacterium koreense TaxID=323761 RepID=A0ABW2ZS87_9MICO
MDISDSVAIVTGGASGLGWATAHRLTAQGARVVVLDIEREGTRDAVAAISPDAVFCAADVTDEEQVRAALATAEALGPVRVLVNCAGVAPSMRVVGRAGVHPLDTFTRTLAVNLGGTFNMARLAFGPMSSTTPIDGERGVIINTASVAAFDGQIGQAAYSASKSGVVGMTLPMAREFASSLIRVVTIAPGIMETPMLAALPQQAQDSLGEQVPHPSRLGRPEEYASLVAHIVTNSYLNGETIRLDGAIRMAPR